MKSVLIIFLGVCLFSVVLSRPTGPGFSDLGVIGRFSRVGSCNSSVESSGTAGCWLSRKDDTSEIFCQIVHNAEATAAILQSVNGAFVTFSQENLQNYIEETFPLSTDSDDTEEADFLSGIWSIILSTQECPSGALIAVLNNDYNVYAFLLGNSALGIAVSDYEPSDKSFDTYISHTGGELEAVLALQDNLGSAETIFEFKDNGTPIHQRINFISAREEELYRQKQFYLLNGESGVIEGDLHVLDPVPDVNYAFEILPLDNSQFVNDSYVPSGAGLFSVHCSGIIEYLVVHNLENILSAQLRLGNDGDSREIFNLQTTRSPIIGADLVSYDVLQRIIEGDAFVWLIDAEGRTLLGKVSPQANFYAYMSPSQEVSRLSGLDRGISLLYLSQRTLISETHFTVSDAEFLELGRGDFGVSESQLFEWGVSGSPFLLQQELSETEFRLVVNEETFLNILTNDVSSGVIRGQVLKRAEVQCISYDGLNPGSSWFSNEPYTDAFVFQDDADSHSSIITVNWTLCFCLIIISLLLWC